MKEIKFEHLPSDNLKERIKEEQKAHNCLFRFFAVTKNGEELAIYRTASVLDADSYYSAYGKTEIELEARQVLLERCYLSGKPLHQTKRGLSGLQEFVSKILLEGQSFEFREINASEISGIFPDTEIDESLAYFLLEDGAKKALYREATIKEIGYAERNMTRNSKPLQFAKTLGRNCFVTGDNCFHTQDSYVMGSLVEAIKELDVTEEFDTVVGKL